MNIWLRNSLFIGAILSLLSGCGAIHQSIAHQTKDKLMQLNAGMTKEETLTVLGKPYKREVYGDREFLIYETDYNLGDYNPGINSEKSNFTPVLLISGKVVGWGRNYYEDTIKSRVDANINIGR